MGLFEGLMMFCFWNNEWHSIFKRQVLNRRTHIKVKYDNKKSNTFRKLVSD